MSKHDSNVLLLINWGIGYKVLLSVLEKVKKDKITVISGSDASSSDRYANQIAKTCVAEDVKFIPQDKSILDEYFGKNDFVISAACPYLLKEELLLLPRFGVVNLHGSLLPKSRGVSPLNWSLINGDKKVGLTTHFIDAEVDSGNIIHQTELIVMMKDNLNSLSDKIALIAPIHIDYLFKNIHNLKTISRTQDLSSSTFAPRLKGVDYLVEINESTNVTNLVMEIKGKQYKQNHPKISINGFTVDVCDIDLSIMDNVGEPPGTIVQFNGDEIIFVLGDKYISIITSSSLPNNLKVGMRIF